MLFMFIPVLHVYLPQILIPDDQKILRILLFSGLREIERPGDHRFPVNDHDLVVGNGVSVIYVCGNA